jgi:hypothetical protein
LGLSQKRQILRKAAQRLPRKIRKSMPFRFWVFPKAVDSAQGREAPAAQNTKKHGLSAFASSQKR